MALPFQDAGWWVLANLDSVLVSAAEGTSAAWYQRDPKLFRSLGWRSLVAHRRLRRNWSRLAKEYRDAARRLQLTREVARDLRGVGQRLTWWPVSSVPTGQRGQSSPADGTDGTELDGTELGRYGTGRCGRAGRDRPG